MTSKNQHVVSIGIDEDEVITRNIAPNVPVFMLTDICTRVVLQCLLNRTDTQKLKVACSYFNSAYEIVPFSGIEVLNVLNYNQICGFSFI